MLPLAQLLASEAYYVALDRRSGQVLWEKPIDDHISACRNILYLQADSQYLIACGSYRGAENDTRYRVSVHHAADGSLVWKNEHSDGKKGAFTHGEQVHHPVVVGDLLVAEPAIYELKSGRRVAPTGDVGDWRIVRPGHSCGSMSASQSCIFFRANNPTVMDMSRRVASTDRFRTLAPSRPGCLINIIPAGGLVLIPEASASCVCNYPLQTSIAFLPKAPVRPVEDSK